MKRPNTKDVNMLKNHHIRPKFAELTQLYSKK